MGLDMHLTKKTYIGAEHEHREVGGKIDITIKDTPVNINFNRVQSIVESVGYWRKANQIHYWFVENVQGGEDDCREYHVSREQFEALLSDINTVLTAKGTPEEEGAIEDIPPREDLEDTKKLVTEILAEMDEDAKNSESWVDYYYQSSW